MLWETLWERQLDVLERHHIARSVWRRRAPDDPFASLVGFELAFRWRARAAGLIVVWAVWTAFWASMGFAGARAANKPADVLVAVGLAAVGLLVITACQVVRVRLRVVIDGTAGFRPAQPPGTSEPFDEASG